MGIVRAVRVIRGQQIALWDRTGILTSKFQARRIAGRVGSKLVNKFDTDHLIEVLRPGLLPAALLSAQRSDIQPVPSAVLSIAEIYRRTIPLSGSRLPAVAAEQDRIRGEQLQAAVALALGLSSYDNHARWPDIISQALEVKLQTSPTIDLGLVLPTDTGSAAALGNRLRYCDARYLIAYGEVKASSETEITDIVVVSGADFFDEFVQFGGLVKNSKRQIRLPTDLFDS